MDRSRIAICIPTFRRNPLLRDCLASLDKISIPANADAYVIVVDNDAHGGARAVLEEHRKEHSLALNYFIEADRGLANVRNRMLEEASRSAADYLAFIDDDEQACPGWLEEHLSVLEENNADVCCGPVRPVGANLEVKGKKPLPSGSTPRHVSTNNVVFKNKLVNSQALRFDTYYNFIGGTIVVLLTASCVLKGNAPAPAPGYTFYQSLQARPWAPCCIVYVLWQEQTGACSP